MTASSERPPAVMFSHFGIYCTAMERLEAEGLVSDVARIAETV
jgi:hypothetical protein